MKLWIATLVAGACLTLGAYVLLAQPADGPGGPGGRMERRGPADRAADADRPAPGDRQRDGKRDGAPADGKEGRKPPMWPMGPLMAALDTDKDGVLSAEEIAAASENLKKLDKNGDGKIDRKELLPPRPQGKRGDNAQGPRDGKGPRDGTDAQDGDRRPPRGDAAPDGPRPGPRGERGNDRRSPMPPATPQE